MSTSKTATPQPVDIHLIDAFTTSPFAGNPAGICYLPTHTSWSTVSPTWMQSVALEMNQAETAFLIPTPAPTTSPDAPPISSFLLRWFTPAAEVDLCGHATLASSHFLYTTAGVPHSHTLHFSTRSGLLTATTVPVPFTPTPAPTGPLIELSLPSDPPVPVDPSSPEYLHIHPILLSSLHLPPSTSGPSLSIHKGKFDFLIELPSSDLVTSLTPDFTQMKRITTRGVGVTAKGGSDGVDFTSRFFAPALAIDEDPVTGSAHCMLAGFWGERLGKEEMVGHQASKRGGIVRVKKDGADRVKLQGYATHTLRGQLLV